MLTHLPQDLIVTGIKAAKNGILLTNSLSITQGSAEELTNVTIVNKWVVTETL